MNIIDQEAASADELQPHSVNHDLEFAKPSQLGRKKSFTEMREEIQALQALQSESRITRYAQAVRSSTKAGFALVVTWVAGNERQRSGKRVIYHGSSFRRALDVSIAFAALCTSVITPLDLGFDIMATYLWVEAIDEVCTGLFVLDLLASFLTTYADMKSDVVVTDRRKITMRYMRGWFFIDLVAAAPMDLLVGGGAGFIAKLFKMPRLLRAFRLMRLIAQLPFQGELLSLLGIFKQLAIVIMLAHWIACLWWTLQDSQADELSPTDSFFAKGSWLIITDYAKADGSSRLEFPESYICSLSAALYMLVGNTDGAVTTAEKSFVSAMSERPPRSNVTHCSGAHDPDVAHTPTPPTHLAVTQLTCVCADGIY